MGKILKVIFIGILVSQSLFAETGEKIVEGKLLEIRDKHFLNYYSVPDDVGNLEIYHACFYEVLSEWEGRYRNILEITPLQISKISSLNEYSQFAANIAKGANQLNALWPNLNDQVRLYIQNARSNGAWPSGPSSVTLDDIQSGVLTDNYKACIKSDLHDELSTNVSDPDIYAGEVASKVDFVAKWDQNEKNGIVLSVDKKSTSQDPSNIHGIIGKISDDSFIRELN